MIETTILYHLGAPGPKMDLMTNSLRRDTEQLSQFGFMARKPRFYREVLQNALILDQVGDFDDTSREQLFSKLTQNQSLERLLLSDGSFLAPVENIFSDELLYSKAGLRTAQLRALFPENETEFLLGLKHPLSLFIENLLVEGGERAAERFTSLDVKSLFWSRVVSDIRIANPRCKIWLWCDEDAASIWPLVLRAVSGIPKYENMAGDLDYCKEQMENKHFVSLRRFLGAQTGLNIHQKCKVMKTYLQRFVDKPLPFLADLDEAQCQELDHYYKDDIATCQNMFNVEFLA